MTNILYQEVQHFRFLQIFVFAAIIIGTIFFIKKRKELKQYKLVLFLSYTLWFLGLAILAIVFNLRLVTTFYADRILYSFESLFTIETAQNEINVSDIKEVRIVKYNTNTLSGNWGVKSYGNNIEGYTTFGSFGLLVRLKDGKAVLIGTQTPEKLYRLLRPYYGIPSDISNL